MTSSVLKNVHCKILHTIAALSNVFACHRMFELYNTTDVIVLSQKMVDRWREGFLSCST